MRKSYLSDIKYEQFEEISQAVIREYPQEDGHPARREQPELLAHGQNPGDAPQAMSNDWLRAQRLLGIKDLWGKTQGYGPAKG